VITEIPLENALSKVQSLMRTKWAKQPVWARARAHTWLIQWIFLFKLPDEIQTFLA